MTAPAEPYTILVLHRGGAQIRGSEEALLTLLRGLDRESFTPIVWCTNPVMRDAVAGLGVEAHVRDFGEIGLRLRDPAFPLRRYLRALRELATFCRQRRVGLLLANGGSPCQLAVPIARLLRIPQACFFHHPVSGRYHRDWLTRHVGRIFFISEFTARHTREQIGRSGDIVSFGIDLRRFSPPLRRDETLRRSLGVAPENVVYAQIGALVPHKEHATLIEAFDIVRSEVPEARLMIIGAGPERGALERLVRERRLEREVVFTGYVDDVVPYLRHVVDVNVLPSREEGFGIVNLQASACGVPNIGADGTGIRETIVDGLSGLLVPVADPASLARSMIHLAREPGNRESLGRSGRSLAEQRFSTEAYCDRIQAVFRDALRDSRGSEKRPDPFTAPARLMK